ncbi:MAG: cyclic nucleotide-binding domain-containing protein [Acidobacteriota bacterium]
MLSWLQGKQDVNRLIAKGQYPKAIKILEKHVKQDPKSIHLRKMLADVLERDGQKRRSIEVLEGLVQEFSSEGFVTKAIAVLKKIQRIDPEQSDADEMLETLVKIRRKDKNFPTLRPRRPEPRSAKATEPPISVAGDDVDEGMVTSVIMPSEFWFEDAAEGRDDFNWSPLFNDFSKGELAAMIGGLRLLIKKQGSIIYTEGEPGDSLFVMASGSARVYQQNDVGHNDQVAVLQEGGVFGTPSVLLGSKRNRTITAITECELLELDRATFETITASHPRVGELVLELHKKRG